MPLWTLAKKDLRLLLRDPRAVLVLLFMPLVFILVLGISLGEGFGQKPEDRLRVSVLNLDAGPTRFLDPFPAETWAEVLLRDLGETADIKVELIGSREEAEELVRNGQRAAVLILGPRFSKRVERCSFLGGGGLREAYLLGAALPQPADPVTLALAAGLDEGQDVLPLYAADGINPFFRDGIRLDILDVEVLRDPTQQTASAILDQVAQGSLLRVIMPWMIGRAFAKVGDPEFLKILGQEPALSGTLVQTFLTSSFVPESERKKLSSGLKDAIQNLFPKYNLTAKTWSALTREEGKNGGGADRVRFEKEGGGWLKRGNLRYQLLVPSYLVMFAFFLVLTMGWMFTAERRQGTLKRLLLAPLTPTQILVGKLLPCLVVSLFQGFFLLVGGRLIFGMTWGPEPAYLALVVVSTSLAATGLALLIAVLARTENQVAIYGTLLVLVLAGLSGGLMGDPSLMPEQMRTVRLITPHAWALDAYRQLLGSPGMETWTPNLDRVRHACQVLAGFGMGFFLLAWLRVRLFRFQ